MKRKSIITSVLVIVLCLGLISGSTFALFTSTSSVNIAVTSGKVKLTATLDENPTLYSANPTLTSGELVDKIDSSDKTGTILPTDPQGTFAGTYYYEQQTGTFANGGTAEIGTDGTMTIARMTPGDKVVTKLSVKNESNVAIKYRLKIAATAEDETNAKILEVLKVRFEGKLYTGLKNYASSWTTKDALANNASETYKSTIEIIFPLDANNDYQNKEINLAFTVEAVQSNANTVDAGTVEYVSPTAPVTQTATVSSVVTTVPNTTYTTATLVAPTAPLVEDGAKTEVVLTNVATANSTVKLTVETTEYDRTDTPTSYTVLEPTQAAVASVDLTLTVNDEIVTAFASGASAKITTYVVKGLDTIDVVYNGDTTKAFGDGGTRVTTSEADVDQVGEYYYDAATGKLVFMTDHFSEYVPATKDEIKAINVTQNIVYSDSANETAFAKAISDPVVQVNDRIESLNLKFDKVENGVVLVGAIDEEKLESAKTLEIPEGVTKVGEYAFYEVAIEKVVCPSTLKTIDDYAFMFESSTDAKGYLTDIELNDGLQTIGYRAFKAQGLTSLTLPSTVTTLGGGAFYQCSNIKGTVVIPSGVTELVETFRGCRGITNVVLNEGLVTVGKDALRETGVSTVELPTTVTTIGDYAFRDVQSLSNIVIKGSTKPTFGTSSLLCNVNAPVVNLVVLNETVLASFIDDGFELNVQKTLQGGKVIIRRPTYVENYSELVAAVDVANSYIIFKNDIEATGTVTIDKNVVLDGNGKTLTTTNYQSENARSINVGWDNSNVTAAIRNLTVEGPTGGYSRGINVASAQVTLDIFNCTITAGHYAINVTSSGNNLKMNIDCSTVSGWAALNIWAFYNEINVTDSTLIGTNDKSESSWNTFATICFEADTTCETDDYGYNNKVTVVNSTIKAIETNSNIQAIVSFNGGNVGATECVLELVNAELVVARYTLISGGQGNTIIADGEVAWSN